MIVETMTPAERLEEAGRLWERVRRVCTHRDRIALKTKKAAKSYPAILPALTRTNKTDGEYTIIEMFMTEEFVRNNVTLPYVAKLQTGWTTRPMLIIAQRVSGRMVIFEVTPHAMMRFRGRTKNTDTIRLDIAIEMCKDIYNYVLMTERSRHRYMDMLPKPVIKQAKKHVSEGWEAAVQPSHYGIWLCESTCKGHYVRVNSFVDNDELFKAQHIVQERSKGYFDFLRLKYPLSIQKEMATQDYIEIKSHNIYN